jgi:hypothetical protein
MAFRASIIPKISSKIVKSHTRGKSKNNGSVGRAIPRKDL